MAGNKKPRTPYKRGRALGEARVAKLNRNLLEEDFKVEIKAATYLHIAEFKEGTATLNGWDSIAEVLNVAVCLSERHYDRAYIDEFVQAIAAHAQSDLRGLDGHPLFYTEEERECIAYALLAHHVQLDQIKFVELTTAIQDIKKRPKVKSKDFIERVKNECNTAGFGA